VSSLIESGVIEEVGSGKSLGGRRPILLQVKPGGRLVCAVHVDDNGDIRARVEDLEGREVGETTSQVEHPELLLGKLAAVVGKLVSQRQPLAAVVVALPGIVSADGAIVSAVNPGWKDIPVAQPLSRMIRTPVLAENAAGLAALGELVARAGDLQSLMYVRIESVVGAAMAGNQEPYRGLRGSTAEIGHTVVDPAGPVCRCGRRGCLETKVSRWALLQDLIPLIREEQPASVTAALPVEAAVFEWLVEHDHGDFPLVQRLLQQAAKHVATALVNALNLIGPEAIVIESPLCSAQSFWTAVQTIVDAETLPFASGTCQLHRSSLGRDAVLRGAAAYGLRYFYEQSWLAAGEP
jgi:predicted NBD/HSP70 family sugar kinase